MARNLTNEPSTPMSLKQIRQHPLFYLFLILVVILGFDLSLTSCASKSSPSGGKKDTLAPQLDTAYPANEMVRFTADKILLEFDEYLKLKNPRKQININPLLGEDLEVISRGKEIEILLKDSLRPNTTYIISFGSSLADLNEGNENKNFKYVFSTGDYLDSLRLSGTVKKAYSNEPLPNYLVALYDIKKLKKRDSFLLHERPDYYAFTDESGSFGMTYLGVGDYLMATFEDKGGTFKLPNKRAALGFVTDTIRLRPDSLYRFDLSVFEPEQNLRFLGGRQKAQGLVQFAFNLPADSFKIEGLEVQTDSSYFLWNAEKDTLNFYYSYNPDSLNFSLNYDSLFVDSVITVRLRDMDPLPMSLRALSTKVRPWDTVVFRSKVVIDKWHPDSIFRYTETDTSNGIKLVADSSDNFQWLLLPSVKKSYDLRFKVGAFETRDRKLKDSIDFKIAVLRGESLGTLSYKVVADSGKKVILQILEDDGTIYMERSFTDSTTVLLKNFIARKLEAFLIEDLDSNGRYTTGDFELMRQPEIRVKYPETLEIRENWELELEWRYQKAPAINKDPLLTTDSIPPVDSESP